MSWRSKKHDIIVRLSAETEFGSIALGMCELLWLKIILEDLELLGVNKLFCDNKSAINVAHYPVQHDRTKHVYIVHHYKTKAGSRLICIPFMPSENKLADMLTTGLASRKFEDLLYKLGIKDIHSPA